MIMKYLFEILSFDSSILTDLGYLYVVEVFFLFDRCRCILMQKLTIDLHHEKIRIQLGYYSGRFASCLDPNDMLIL